MLILICDIEIESLDLFLSTKVVLKQCFFACIMKRIFHDVQHDGGIKTTQHGRESVINLALIFCKTIWFLDIRYMHNYSRSSGQKNETYRQNPIRGDGRRFLLHGWWFVFRSVNAILFIVGRFDVMTTSHSTCTLGSSDFLGHFHQRPTTDGFAFQFVGPWRPCKGGRRNSCWQL